MNPSQARPKVNLLSYVTLGIGFSLVLLLALALRYQTILSESLWLDELHTSWVVGGPLADVQTRAAEGNQPPLFFWITWAFQQVVGENELTLRMVSVISSAALIVLAGSVVFYHSKSIFGSILTAAIIGLGDPFLCYGTEARPYGLLQLLSLLQIICYWRSLQHLTKNVEAPSTQSWRHATVDLSCFVLTSWMLIYTHYSAALIAVPELLFASMWLVARGAPINFGRIIFTVGITVIGCLPLLANLELVYGRRENWESVASVEKFIQVDGLRLFVWILVPSGIWWVGSKAGLFGVDVGEGESNAKWLSGGSSRTTQFAGLMVCWGVLIFLAIVVIHVCGFAPLAMTRYYSVGVVAGPVLCGLLFAKAKSIFHQVILLAVLLVVQVAMARSTFDWVATSIQQRRPTRMRTETWFQAITEINRDQRRKDYPLLLFGAVIEDADALTNRDPAFQSYLQFPVRGMYSIEPPNRFVFAGPTLGNPHFADTEIDRVRSAGGAWLLIRHNDDEVNRIVFELCDYLHIDRGSVRRFQAPDSLVVVVVVDLVVDL